LQLPISGRGYLQLITHVPAPFNAYDSTYFHAENNTLYPSSSCLINYAAAPVSRAIPALGVDLSKEHVGELVSLNALMLSPSPVSTVWPLAWMVDGSKPELSVRGGEGSMDVTLRVAFLSYQHHNDCLPWGLF
jgi:hypothetical protein